MANLQSQSRSAKRKRRHFRVRAKINGTTAVPRLNVFKSNGHFYAQLIDDVKQKTIVAASTLKMAGLKSTSNIAAAEKVGAEIAKKALDKKVTTVVFDRGGYLYHGKVKAFAEAARKAGLKF
ncbi:MULTISPECIES: 50S ribosomal protein L18 [unclassified Spiroplasma]|uniref:50S ribosomal protein L18 n=1 Tax=unclassified Spiroplasma TaxID=2637901 RepID=UPI000F8607BA|nr:50S ribosomal protein L18 [Spiroplasma endosymbiont of Megaselia nigra]RUO86926.1 50S ribosomal protein L18 [Spiroplasma endosymbiont of Megaselia nigra]